MGTLKFKDQPLWLVIIASWAIAFFEYLFQVSADRIGSERLAGTASRPAGMHHDRSLRIIAGLLFRQILRWNNVVAAVYFTFNFEQ
jgi:uncharacterized protein